MSQPVLSSLARELLEDLAMSWRPRIGCDAFGNPDGWELEGLARRFETSPADIALAVGELRARKFLQPQIVAFDGITPLGWLQLDL